MSVLKPVEERPSFPKNEQEVLRYWKKIEAFEKSIEISKNRKKFVFYDGPPFATGLPHYGHLLASTIKDTICRYAFQRGYSVPRRFGWDCHGLPIEREIDRELNLQTREDVLEYGIAQYNDKCRSIVQRYSTEWRTVIEKLGRWIDFDNDYKTMDPTFMESVWWVFQRLFEKQKIYRAFRVMPFSTALNTPLSNFEVSQNYKDVSDPSIIVALRVTKDESFNPMDEEVFLLIWTTTPWTLPSNLAVCVHPDLIYLIFEHGNRRFICGDDRLDWVRQQGKFENLKILRKFEGKQLEGVRYKPIFDYFAEYRGDCEKEKFLHKNRYQVILGNYVTTETGTCCVHQAPAFGEDDFGCCCEYEIVTRSGMGLVCPVDDSGRFTREVKDFAGIYVKDADKRIVQLLKSRHQIIAANSEVHSYPHCWRSDTPLIYKAVASWFVDVESIRDNLTKNNDETYWVPPYVKEKRFKNWLESARDWCVSRNRYWGTPIPLWVSDDLEEVLCIGSIDELEKKSGKRVSDLHREFVDEIEIPSQRGKGTLRRIDEVFDCWFESGSMPYASKHYPFKDEDHEFPADFIAEGLDQTRGWFYTLMVLGTHLFDKSPFRNVIVNGLVLASDGKKMSKKEKNYADPVEIMDSLGADSVRLYLVSSNVVRGETLRFQESGVREMIKDVFLPYHHAYRFFVQQWVRHETATGKQLSPSRISTRNSKNLLDLWITSSLQSLIQFVRDELSAYRLYTVVPRLLKFLNQLTNWYVRLNRDRMRQPTEDGKLALLTMYEVILDLTVLLAPIVPFITESVYQNLKLILEKNDERFQESVHFVLLPKCENESVKLEIEKQVEDMQKVVELGRHLRDKRKAGMKLPIQSLTVIHPDEKFIKNILETRNYIEDEVNVLDLQLSQDMSSVDLKASPNFRDLGKKLGKDMGKVKEALSQLPQETIKKLESEEVEFLTICGHEIKKSEVVFDWVSREASKDIEIVVDQNCIVLGNFASSTELFEEALLRDLVRRIQQLRKKQGLNPEDAITVFWSAENRENEHNIMIEELFSRKADKISELLRRPFVFRDFEEEDERFEIYYGSSNSVGFCRIRIHRD